MPEDEARENAREADWRFYAGRWIALVGEQIAGVGRTAAEASRLARRNRPKERFALRYVDPAGGVPLNLSPILLQVEEVLLAVEQPVYLVGGAVRDALLNTSHGDLDYIVAQDGIKLAFRVANALGVPAYVLDRKRDVGRVILVDQQTTLDFARMRGGNLDTDLRDRDFTLNAMALPAGARSSASIIDPCDGQGDLASGWVRQTHRGAIADDPVRALRALRMALRFDLRLTEDTALAVAAMADSFQQISAERIRDELLKLLMTKAPHLAVQQMDELGLLATLLPEVAALSGITQSLPHHEDVLSHSCTVLQWLTRLEGIILGRIRVDDGVLAQAQTALEPYRSELVHHLSRPVDGGLTGHVLLRLGALFHDVGKPATRTVEPDGRIRFLGHEKVGARLAHRCLKRLHLSNEACKTVRRIVAEHMRPLHLAQAPRVTRRAAYRFYRDTGAVGIDVALLSLADCLATYDEPGQSPAWPALLDRVAWLFEHYFHRHEESVSPQPLLTGRELMEALQLTPGPEIGRLLRIVQEAQAVGEIQTANEAVQLARQSRRSL